MKTYDPIYFKFEEFDSPDAPGSGFDIDPELLRILDVIRTEYGKPIHVNSAVRSESHNQAVGGSSKSQHLLGRAADLHIPNQEVGDLFEAIALREGAKGIGRYNTFIHIDTRENPHERGHSYWDNRKHVK